MYNVHVLYCTFVSYGSTFVRKYFTFESMMFYTFESTCTFESNFESTFVPPNEGTSVPRYPDSLSYLRYTCTFEGTFVQRCTFESTKVRVSCLTFVLSYFRTFVLPYFRTSVLSYESSCTFVLPYTYVYVYVVLYVCNRSAIFVHFVVPTMPTVAAYCA